MRALVVLLAAALAAAAAPAQIAFGEMGFQVSSPSGGVAGDSCWGFDCTPRRLTVQRGEVLTLTVRAPLGSPFVVVASPGASSCLRIPGLWHALVVDPPVFVLVAGNIDRPNPTRFCYDGYALHSVRLPVNLPLGAQAGLQAAAAVGTPQSPAAGFATSSAVLLLAVR